MPRTVWGRPSPIRRSALVAIAVVAGLAVAAAADPATEVVTTQAGPVRGAVDDGIHVFKGLPFAAPPVGDLRWRPPQPAAPWRAVRDATAYGPRCMQSDRLTAFTDRIVDGSGMNPVAAWAIKRLRPFLLGGEMAEDCLYLNVRTPTLDPAAKRPVMVWFHGGGYTSGSGSASIYNANGLPAKGAVVVTVNYRLGVFGFLAHPDLRAEDAAGAVGNYGLRDQVAALDWVRANIARFGGDPDNVTIFGESAGAYAVASLMTSPLSRGLFHRAIGQSGCGVTIAGHARVPVAHYDAAEALGAAFAERVAGDGGIAALRALDAAMLTEASFADAALLRHQRPIVDGVALTEAMGVTFAKGAAHPVPWLLGWNADEGTIFVDTGAQPIEGNPVVPTDEASYRALLAATFGRAADRAARLFPYAGSARAANARLHGETRFAAPCWWAAQRHAAAGNPTYLYYFTRVPPRAGQNIGAYHAAEIAFVFDSHPPLLPRDTRDAWLTDKIGDYWIGFAATGDPNHAGAPAHWAAFGPDARRMLHLDSAAISLQVPEGAARYDFLERRTRALNAAAAPAPAGG